MARTLANMGFCHFGHTCISKLTSIFLHHHIKWVICMLILSVITTWCSVSQAHSNLGWPRQGLSTHSGDDSIKSEIHLALIFDYHYTKFAKQVVNSYLYYNRKKTTIFHMITDVDGEIEIRKAFFNLTEVRFKFYDIDNLSSKSESFLSADALSYFKNRKFTTMDTIQLTLHEHILQDKVLYLDVDTTIVNDITPCYEHDMGDKLIGLSVDMGAICQEQPSRCWPLSSLWRVPQKLRCDAGILPKRSCKTQRYQSFMYNFGVSLMNLKEMRFQNFTTMFNQATEFTGKLVGRAAEWGAQEMINSMPLYHHRTIATLNCGCNYQCFGRSRFLLCPSQQIRIVHAW